MISVTLLIKNVTPRLKEVLDSVSLFQEIVLIDTENCLQGMEFKKNVQVFSSPFIGFGPLHNLAASKASFDWILSIDADEVVSKQLAEEILHLNLDPKTVYKLPFKNYALNQWIRHSGWFPESHIRLYHRKHTGFSNVMVHEGVETTGMKIHSLKGYVHHYSYDSISTFVTKMQFYSDLFVEDHLHQKRSSLFKALTHGVASFFKHYFLKKGFLDGGCGLCIAFFQGSTAFIKYLKLYYAQKNTRRLNVSQSGDRKTCHPPRSS